MRAAKGLRFIWRIVRVLDGNVLLFKEFIDDGSAYDEHRGDSDRGWWTGEQHAIARADFWA